MLLPSLGLKEMCRGSPSLLLGLCPSPLNFVGCSPICGSSAVGQYEAQLCFVPVLNGHICSLSHIPNEKQGLDLLLGTHSGGILLGLILVVLLHADLDKGQVANGRFLALRKFF